MRTLRPPCERLFPTAQPAWTMTNEPLPRTGTEVVVELRGIKKSFGSTEVLHGVDLTIHTGEHVVVFGPSGSGKSTLLRTINLLEEPTEGSVRLLGVEYGPGLPGEKSKRGGPLQLRRHVGMVFQQFNLFPHLTALHNISLALRSVKRHGSARGRGAGGGRAPSGRASPLRGPIPRRALRRAAAARRDRPRAQPRPEGHALRRADLGPRSRARGRGARRHARVGGVRA